MAPSAPAPTLNGVSTIAKLASFLRQAREITGQISFHSSLHNTATHFVRSSESASDEQVADMVQALDCDEPKLCARLSVNAFIIVFAVLRASKPSWPKHRGLYLLAESLTDSDRHNPSTQPSSSSLDSRALLPRKARIGTELLKPSVKHFCNRVANDDDRRWMGVLALELLKDCKENVHILVSQFGDCQEELGSTMIDEQNELLRYIAGSIVRQLVRNSLSLGPFWPTGIDVAAHTAFLEPQVQSSQWFEIFEGCLDTLDSQTKTHNEKFAPFSRLLRLGNNTYASPDAHSPSVLVTINGLLSIVVLEYEIQSGENRAAQYIDIPLENIIGVDVTRSSVDGSTDSMESHTRFMVHIQLVNRETDVVYVNARAQRQQFVDLAFDDEAIADCLKALIHTRQSRNKSIRLGTHAVLDGSQSVSMKTSLDIGNSLPMSMEAQNLIATAAHAEEILERQLSRDTHDLPDLALTSGRVHNKPKNMSQATRISSAGSPMLASVGDPEAQFGSMIDAAHEMAISNGDCLSLSQWKDGAETIESALEFVDHNLDHSATANATAQPRQEHDSRVGNMLRDAKGVQKVLAVAGVGTLGSEILTGGPLKIPTHASRPTAKQPLSGSKVSRRLLGRHGEPVKALETSNRKPGPATSTKALPKARTFERDNASKSPPKGGGEASHAASPGKSVYDLPSSPPKVSKAQPAGKGRKTQAKSSTTKVQKSAPKFELSKENQSLRPTSKAGTTETKEASSSKAIVNNNSRTDEDGIVEGAESQEGLRDSRSANGPLHGRNNPKITKNGKASQRSILPAAPKQSGKAAARSSMSKARMRDPPPNPAIPKRGKKSRTAAINANQKIQGIFPKSDKQADRHVDERAGSHEASDPDDTGESRQGKMGVTIEYGNTPLDGQQNLIHSEGIKDTGVIEAMQSHNDTNDAEANNFESHTNIDDDADTHQPVFVALEKSESANKSRHNDPAESRLTAASQSRSRTLAPPEAELVAVDDAIDLIDCGSTTSRSRPGTLDRRENGSGMISESHSLNSMVRSENASTPNAASQLDLVEDTVAIPVARMIPLPARSDVPTIPKTSLALSQNLFQSTHRISEGRKSKPTIPSLKIEPMKADMNASIKDNDQGEMSNIIHISSGEESSPSNEQQSSEEGMDVLHGEEYVHKKRKLDDVVKDSIKRVKVSTSKPAKEIGTAENADKVMTKSHAQQKATTIGFSEKGPRNQGVVLPNRARGVILPQERNEKSHNTPGLPTKRKHVDVQDIAKSTSPQRLAKTPADKRRRTVNVVPPTREEDQPAFIHTTSSRLQSVSQKLSSQGTRVQDNGSPMATADQVRRVTNISMDGLLRRLTDDCEVELRSGENREKETIDSVSGCPWGRDMELPPIRRGLPLDEPAAERKSYIKRSSSNMKLQPSSPTAPSRMLEDMAAHKMQSNGQFINLHTATIVRTTIPQDPFMAKGPDPQSSFMQMLRASVQTNKDNQIRTAKELGSTSRLFIDSASHYVDPDRTLVNNERAQQPSSNPRSSSSPPISGTKRGSVVSDSDEREKREGLADVWRNALREHHRGTLGCLYDMSNRLVKHLLDKESAIEDAVVDYDTGGARLVEALSTAQRDSRRDFVVKINDAKQTLTKAFGKFESHLTNSLKDTKSKRAKDLQKKWLEEQQKIHSDLESAMTAWGQ